MGNFDFGKHILHHMQNSYEWHLPLIKPIHLPELITLHGLMVLVGAGIILFVFCVLYNKNQKVPTGLTNLLECIIIFIRDEIAIGSLGKEDGRRMAPMFCTFFFFILSLNLMGLIPIFSSATANVNVTAALASITFVFMVFGAIYKNGLKGFLKAVIPSGIPLPILFILVPLEIFGLLIKTFALMIRLFANMLGGHITIAVLIGLVVLLGYFALPMLALALFIYLMEVLIAFIQAYVFTLLSAMFIAQTYHPEH